MMLQKLQIDIKNNVILQTVLVNEKKILKKTLTFAEIDFNE